MKKLDQLEGLDTNQLTENDKRGVDKLKQELMQEQLKTYLSHPGHKMPTTRREFLAAGLTSWTGYMVLPSAMTMLANAGMANAQSIECPKADAATIVPKIININMAGGMGIQGVVVGLDNDNNGQLLPSYSQMSMGTRPASIINRFGLALNGDNPFAQTLINIATKYGITDNQLKGINIVCRTNSDSSDNPFGVQGMATQAGFLGDKLPGLGTQNSTTGGNFLSARLNPPRPLVVGNFTAISNSLQVQGALASFSQKQKEAVLTMVNKFNDRQLASLSSAGGFDQLNKLLYCAGVNNMDILKAGTSGIDPRQDAGVAAIWNDTAVNPAGAGLQTLANGQTLARAGMIYNTLTGAAGVTTISLGGYDYHANSLVNVTRPADRNVADLLGRALATASVMKVPCAVILNTDGSCVSGNSNAAADWAGDNNNSSQLLFLYHPNGVQTTSGQIGAWNQNQSVNLTFGPADNRELLAAITLANIMKFAGKTSMIQQVTGLSPNDRNIKVA